MFPLSDLGARPFSLLKYDLLLGYSSRVRRWTNVSKDFDSIVARSCASLGRQGSPKIPGITEYHLLIRQAQREILSIEGLWRATSAVIMHETRSRTSFVDDLCVSASS